MNRKAASPILLMVPVLLLASACDNGNGTCAGLCDRTNGPMIEMCFIAGSEEECRKDLLEHCTAQPGALQGYLETNFNPGCDSCSADCVEYPQLAAAPNIYLYPEATRDVHVTLETDQGRSIPVSVPEYDHGWNVSVEPSGLIDGKYDYLYYEAIVNLDAQNAEGWTIERAGIFPFFEDTLAAYGFENNEIADFLVFWEPALPRSACYMIYPQLDRQVSQMVGLKVDPAPDTVRRLWFVVEPRGTCDELPAPAIEPLARIGFTVVEWGVVLQ
ncbi:MAG: hypothetical protein PHU25_05955 [Deltaproteobacteria bacterium]|nr:hypothetical protein [Deltaproteobacteria bacterium]